MTNHNKKILSISIPTFNGSDTISKTLDILLPQCDSRVEVIISDNCSTDNTSEVINEYLIKYPFIRYVRNKENIGPDSNFLQCMNLAKGEYSLLLSDDDVFIEGKLKELVNFLEESPELSLVYLQAKGFHENYKNEESCEKYKKTIYDNKMFFTKDKKLFMDYASRMWGFVSCFIYLTKAFKEIDNPEQFKKTYWLQSYIHILCSNYGEKNLGIVSKPCIGAGIYSVVSNFDTALGNVKNYKEMLDFAIKNGFDKKQLNDFFIWRTCFIEKRILIKEKASGIKKTDIKLLYKCTKKYPKAWFELYPFVILPQWVCRIVVEINAKRKYKETLHLDRIGDVQG